VSPPQTTRAVRNRVLLAIFVPIVILVIAISSWHFISRHFEQVKVNEGFRSLELYTLSPGANQRFDIYPRIIQFNWYPVTGASKYRFELENLEGAEFRTVFSLGAFFGRPYQIVDTNSFTYECPGKGLYRWRVTALNSNDVESKPSQWMTFESEK
jgi:hypothetical protein